jgi:hypothetical protein
MVELDIDKQRTSDQIKDLLWKARLRASKVDFTQLIQFITPWNPNVPCWALSQWFSHPGKSEPLKRSFAANHSPDSAMLLLLLKSEFSFISYIFLLFFFSIPVWIAPKMTQFRHWATWPNSQRPCAMGWCVWGCRRSRPGETSPSARTALHSLRTTEGYSVFDPTPGGWSWELKCWWTSIDEHCMSHRTGTSSLGVIQLVLWQNGQRNGDTIESWSKYKWLGPIGYPKIYLMVYPHFAKQK